MTALEHIKHTALRHFITAPGPCNILVVGLHYEDMRHTWELILQDFNPYARIHPCVIRHVSYGIEMDQKQLRIVSPTSELRGIRVDFIHNGHRHPQLIYLRGRDGSQPKELA